ncbi:MAG: haloacid dehalogenase [Sphingomonas sp. SCN 67-18]|uniref:HAD family hydrolase n=1 Tax=uncultured Sphingomonas sp. TaxID=158754 RepID=UPI00086E0649|nr:HAD-IB family hydrolase [Sphingomonas sp. SCN 67-18]ODU20256.1 MAG: haloacid dehalogenase [Sphingomonas sp. SCN 67-18]
MTRLAIYDMDRTITRAATYTPFLIHAAARLAPWRFVFLPLVALTMLAYAARLINRARLKEINQLLLLGGAVSRETLAPLVAGFAEKTIANNVYPGAVDQLAADRADGWRLVLATASYRLYVEAIAERLGFDAVIATGSMIGLDSRIIARIDGENCYGPAKLRMIQAWMAAEGLERGDAEIRFYSDHASDAPVLEWADQPFAVNAHARLRTLARARGWTIIDW